MKNKNKFKKSKKNKVNLIANSNLAIENPKGYVIELPMLQRNPQFWQKWIIFFTFLTICLLYISTLAPTLSVGDCGEFIAVSSTLGIPHPPGYPLYVLLGKLFSLLPIGDIAWRINLSSAVFNVIAIFIIYLTLYELIQYWVPAILGAIFFSVSPLIWEYSLKAEVFALNNLFAASILYLIVIMRKYYFQFESKHINQLIYKQKSRTILYLLLFVCGLSLTHHHTIILLSPAVIIAIYFYNKCSHVFCFRIVNLSIYSNSRPKSALF